MGNLGCVEDIFGVSGFAVNFVLSALYLDVELALN